MLLPCIHIFVARQSVGLQLFDESLVNNRWKKATLTKPFEPAVCSVSISSTSIGQILTKPTSEEKKFRIAMDYLKRITHMSTCVVPEFNECIH